MSKPPRHKELPSGDVMTMWGLAVRRPAEHPSGKKADGIACVTFDPALGGRVAGWRIDDVVAVEGALHQRYRPGAGGGVSTYEVEVHHAHRLQEHLAKPPGVSAAQGAEPDARSGPDEARPVPGARVAEPSLHGRPAGDPPPGRASSTPGPAPG
ncbi:hypothetical protein Sme01_28460 [Sphaerisporangium melleum]|uniref:Single-stranded DNA-binding protein n=1 Tax=Sphaerisporangium melleum TaxID=321316 RepID=A0A917R2A5_9ACTN|nr:hypothetical protein [Sphaerisporangium melleum]GGK84149.1 hypothetical protein GCM10007964_28230 [Sphaerisporangium melleum]GII70370.1 hypothetical protein Sme01_28460 [Sphaerisporangium melleum]